MNKYVLITSMKPVFDCFDVSTRTKLRRTCKWCNKHIRRHLNKIGAQLIIRRAWYYYKLYKNLCISAHFTPIENLKMVISRSITDLNPADIANLKGIIKVYALKNYTKCSHSYEYFKDSSFKDIIKNDIELVLPINEELISGQIDILKSCYIKLYGNHKNLTIDLEIGYCKWLTADIPENATAIRVHFGSFPIMKTVCQYIDIKINYPLDLQRRYLHGSILDSSRHMALTCKEKIYLDNKMFIEAFYPNGSRERIGNVVNKYIVHIGYAETVDYFY
jgi:hypothetical protein